MIVSDCWLILCSHIISIITVIYIFRPWLYSVSDSSPKSSDVPFMTLLLTSPSVHGMHYYSTIV